MSPMKSPAQRGRGGARMGTRPLRSSYRHLDAVLDDARADRVPGQTRRVMDVQLGHEVLAMLVHGLETDAQLLRDLLVGFAFGDQLQHFRLPRAQLVHFFAGLAGTAGFAATGAVGAGVTGAVELICPLQNLFDLPYEFNTV